MSSLFILDFNALATDHAADESRLDAGRVDDLDSKNSMTTSCESCESRSMMVTMKATNRTMTWQIWDKEIWENMKTLFRPIDGLNYGQNWPWSACPRGSRFQGG